MYKHIQFYIWRLYMKKIKRGEIYLANLNDYSKGSEQCSIRPVLIIQNNLGNKHSPTTIVTCLTSKLSKTKLPTHYLLRNKDLKYKSIVLTEQIRVIDKNRLLKKISKVDNRQMAIIDKKLKISLSLNK